MPIPTIVLGSEVADARQSAAIIAAMDGFGPRDRIRELIGERWPTERPSLDVFYNLDSVASLRTRTAVAITTLDGLKVWMRGTGSGASSRDLALSFADRSVRENPIGANRLMFADAELILADVMAHGWNRDVTPILAGHSYGGGVMSILGALMVNRGITERVKIHSFGSPCPGDGRLAVMLSDQRLLRWMNTDDGVPYLPPTTQFFPALADAATERAILAIYGLNINLRANSNDVPSYLGTSGADYVQPGEGIQLDGAGNVSRATRPRLTYRDLGVALRQAGSVGSGGPGSPNDSPYVSPGLSLQRLAEWYYRASPGNQNPTGNDAYFAHLIREYSDRLASLSQQFVVPPPLAQLVIPPPLPVTQENQSPAVIPAILTPPPQAAGGGGGSQVQLQNGEPAMPIPTRFKASARSFGNGQWGVFWMDTLISQGEKSSPCKTFAKRMNSWMARMPKLATLSTTGLTDALADFIAQTSAGPADLVPPIPWD